MASLTTERQISISGSAWQIYCMAQAVYNGLYSSLPDEATSIQMAKDAVQAAKYFETARGQSDFFDPFTV